MSIKVLIVDDHQIMREGLRYMFEKESDIEVISEAENGRQALQMATKMNPDVIIMDINMPDMNGTEATKRILKDAPWIKIVALSMHSDRVFVAEMLKAGAYGYLLKDCSRNDILNAIRAVYKNKRYLGPEITGIVLEDYVQRINTEDNLEAALLTSKEREILQLIAEGNTSKQIASNLNIALKTVESHRVNIMNKLDIHNIADLTKFAIRHRITQVER